ncbi:putative fatty acid amide hydrolase isoform X1 [Sesbania bispinosa]|nr:putative fatty acid amide hydrolase isoform X1 [Sesbania bispinosa]
MEPGVVVLDEDGRSEDRLESALKCLPHYDPAQFLENSASPFLYWKILEYAYGYRSRKVTTSMVGESIISIIEENGINKSPAPLLISFDATEVQKQAAASTQRTYIVTGDDGHYVAMIMEIEIGAKVIPNFAAGLHFSGPVEKFLIDPITKKPIVNCVVSNKGCSSRPYSRA